MVTEIFTAPCTKLDLKSTGNIWTSTIERDMKSYISLPNRLWKIEVYQKDTMNHYQLLMSDYDFQALYPNFTKNEKQFFNIFRPGIKQTLKEHSDCLSIIGHKLGLYQTDIGSTLFIGIKQKPNHALNPLSKDSDEIYFPLLEFSKQKPMGEFLRNEQAEILTSRMTNAKAFVLQTTCKGLGVYLNICVYYMIPLGIFF